MNDWTKIDETHYETDDKTLLFSPHKLAILNRDGQVTHFVAVLPDKPQYAIPLWQMQAEYDEAYRVKAFVFVFEGVTYRLKTSAQGMKRLATDVNP